MRLAVVSPFLDRQHGTERCIIEQIERFVSDNRWTIELYSQRVSQIKGLAPATEGDKATSIFWRKVRDIPGPHLIKYVWWLCANQWSRSRDRRSGKVCPDLVYSPGINCFDADVIVVHIVFHAFYDQVRSKLMLSRSSLRSWPLLVHRRLYYRLIMLLERKIYRDSGVRLIAVSNVVAAQLKRHFRREDVTVIRNAVDTSQFNAEARISKRAAARQSFGYHQDEFVLLLIGNDWKKKGLDVLLRALASLQESSSRALIVGSDDSSMYKDVLDRFGLRARIRFAGVSSDVLAYYAAADAYVGPSLEDAFNLPILEAMACGLPVIASAQAGAAELIRDGETGFILTDPQDHAHLADLIRRLHADDRLRVAVGEAASRYALAHCSWNENAQKTREFLELALQRLRKRGSLH